MDITNVRALRRVMGAFIRADLRMVSLSRKKKIDSGAGSWVWGDAQTLPPQPFRLVPMKRRLSDLTSDTQDGRIPAIDYVLVGQWNADILVGDEFTLNSTQYKIVGIEPHTNERSHTDRVVAQLEVRDK